MILSLRTAVSTTGESVIPIKIKAGFSAIVLDDKVFAVP